MRRIAIGMMFLLSLAGSAKAGYIYSYGGDAVGARVDVPLVAPVTFADTGGLPPAGGQLDATEASASVYLGIFPLGTSVLSTGILTSSADGGTTFASLTQSSSSVDGISLLDGLIQVTAVSTTAYATINSVDAITTITGLTIGGIGVTVTGDPNQSIDIAGVGTLVLNEQISSVGPTSSSMVVNALRLSVLTGLPVIGGIEVILAHSYASLDYTFVVTPVPEPGSFAMVCGALVTGGGINLARRRKVLLNA